jgi:excisionase family DNA binding protein
MTLANTPPTAVAVPLTPEPSPWLTVEESRHLAKCGAKLIYREIKAGRLRAARLGGRSGAIRIHRTWITEWLEFSAAPIEMRR